MHSRASLEVLRNLADPIEILTTFGGVNISDILESGDEIRCPCPLHNGDNKTGFVWSRSKGLWYCFTHKCGSALRNKHDVYEFVALKLGISFSEAAERVAERCGFNLEKAEASRRDSQLISNTNYVRDKLISNKYLISELEALTELPGYNAEGMDDVLAYLQHRNYTYDQVKPFNLYPMRDSFGFERMGIPVYDENGKLVGANGRLMDNIFDYPEEVVINGKTYPVPKYKMTKFDKGSVLYNLNNARRHSFKEGLILVEGQLDTIRLWNYGIYNSVCTLGTNLSTAQTSLVYRNCFRVTFLVEEGEAAEKGVISSIKKLRTAMKIFIAELPSGDANSNTKETILNTLKGAKELSVKQIDEICTCNEPRLP